MKRLVVIMLPLGALAVLAAGDQEELIWQEGKWVRPAAPAKGTPAGELGILRRDFDRKRYAAVVRTAKSFQKRHRGDPLLEEIFCLAGDAELHRGRHWQAYKWYDRQLRAFPNGKRVERTLERQMRVAEAFLAGKRRRVLLFFSLSAEEEGIEILERVAALAPSTSRAETALLAIADHYYGKRKWGMAADSCEKFLEVYPKSPRAGHAELRLAEALWRSYRGPLWDDTPLIEAEQRYRTFVEHHPAAAQQANVPEILKEIYAQRARKPYEIGRFYVRTGHPVAAAYYFRLVGKEYADTRWAREAQALLFKLRPSGAPREPARAGKGLDRTAQEAESGRGKKEARQ